MYAEKMQPILGDLENKNIEVAGGSAIGMILSIVNSLIKYISNMTLDKKKYENVQEDIKNISINADKLKKQALEVVDKDKKILERILESYKKRVDDNEGYTKACREAVEFCMEVVNLAFYTLELSNQISKVGNKMLSSDFKICKYYSFASIQAAIVNVDINLKPIEDKKYKEEIEKKYNQILEKSRSYIE